MNIEKIVELVIALISLGITGFLIPYLQNKWGNEKLTKVASWVKIAVTAAEQIFQESGMGAQKKAYVIEYLNKNGIKISSEKLDALIESTVFEMNKEIENALKVKTVE